MALGAYTSPIYSPTTLPSIGAQVIPFYPLHRPPPPLPPQQRDYDSHHSYALESGPKEYFPAAHRETTDFTELLKSFPAPIPPAAAPPPPFSRTHDPRNHYAADQELIAISRLKEEGDEEDFE